MNEITVFDSEIEDIDFSSEWSFKYFLKSKGMPFVGYFNIQPDPNFVYNRIDGFDGSTRFQWKAK